MENIILSLILIVLFYQNFLLRKNNNKRAFNIKYPLFSERNIDDSYNALAKVGKHYMEVINQAYLKKDGTKDEQDKYLNFFIETSANYIYLRNIYELAIDLNVAISNGKKFKYAYLEWEEFTFVQDSKRKIMREIAEEVREYKNFDKFVSDHLSGESYRVDLYLEGIKR